MTGLFVLFVFRLCINPDYQTLRCLKISPEQMGLSKKKNKDGSPIGKHSLRVTVKITKKEPWERKWGLASLLE